MLAEHFPARAAAGVRRGRTEIDNCLVDPTTAASTEPPEGPGIRTDVSPGSCSGEHGGCLDRGAVGSQ